MLVMHTAEQAKKITDNFDLLKSNNYQYNGLAE
jgi:hypothetical protein